MKYLLVVSMTLLSFYGVAQQPFHTPTCQVVQQNKIVAQPNREQAKQLVQGHNNTLFFANNFDQGTKIQTEALSLLKGIKDSLDERGITLVMVPVPSRIMFMADDIPAAVRFDRQKMFTDYQQHVITLQQAGIDAVDLSDLTQTNNEPLFFKRDIHWKPQGALEVAKRVKQYLAQLDVFEQLSSKKFTIKYNGVKYKKSQQTQSFNRVCETGYPNEYYKHYTVVGEETDSSLFSDETNEIVLLGTSFSAVSTLSFEAFLSAQLQMPLANHALTGGGLAGSISQYFVSDEFQQSPPKIVLWEYPIRQINSEMLAPVLPLLQKTTCDDNSLISESHTLGDNKKLLAYNGGRNYQNILQQQLILDIQFENKLINTLTAHVHFTNGQVKQYSIGNDRTSGLNGRFILDLSHSEKNSHYLALELDSKKPNLAGEKVTIKVCRKP